MKASALSKYSTLNPELNVNIYDRIWPNSKIKQAPLWCSVDLRDGNQALSEPMKVKDKLRLFNVLCGIGYNHIEIGFPSASETEYNFVRYLIEHSLIPKDIYIQVLTQARVQLINSTFKSIRGVPKAITHLYNATSPLFCDVVFKISKDEVIHMAAEHAHKFILLAKIQKETQWTFQYSPETFMVTEPYFSYKVCLTVLEIWELMMISTRNVIDRKIILNLPSTVEIITPNLYADQIEWFSRRLETDGLRKCVQISLHTHNDRGTGIAATELGILAGADRVEGTLYGNGERTGNIDIVTVSLNMNSQGIKSGLDFSNLSTISTIYEECTCIHVHERHPYAGKLVFTAFSGSHQDAISKVLSNNTTKSWNIPYFTIDPKDIGKNDDNIIRINSQSGKGGIIYVLHKENYFNLPKSMHSEVGYVISLESDRLGKEFYSKEIQEVFIDKFVNCNKPLNLVKNRNIYPVERIVTFLSYFLEDYKIIYNNLTKNIFSELQIVSYYSYTILKSKIIRSSLFLHIRSKHSSKEYFGCGINTNIELAVLNALVSVINISLKD